MDIKIKDSSKNVHIAFGGGGKLTLGERSQEDLKKLAILALSSKNKNLLQHFDGTLPSMEDLQKEITATKIAEVPKATKDK